MTTQTSTATETDRETLKMLTRAYRMEVETIANYLANSIHLDGMRAEEVKRSLGEDVAEELGHARKLANRIKQLGGRIPGSLELRFDQETLRPPEKTTDVESVIQGVIDAETEAIEHYRTLIRHTEETGDSVTADLATQLLADEEEHRTQFRGFQAGLDAGSR